MSRGHFSHLAPVYSYAEVRLDDMYISRSGIFPGLFGIMMCALIPQGLRRGLLYVNGFFKGDCN
jgi:hypothetical protein